VDNLPYRLQDIVQRLTEEDLMAIPDGPEKEFILFLKDLFSKDT
jgi:hypothetical protein